MKRRCPAKRCARAAKCGQVELVIEPDPLTEQPPPDRYCDLVLTGGVASGVVYPWAMVEIARHFRFKSIGGTSVGAMAAALGAAAEYGRRCGSLTSFEVLRRLPGKLATEIEGGTTLQALFQPSPAGRRLFRIFIDAVGVFAGKTNSKSGCECDPKRSNTKKALLWRSLGAFRSEAARGAVLGVLLAALAVPLSVLAWVALACATGYASVCRTLAGAPATWLSHAIDQWSLGHALLALPIVLGAATIGAAAGIVCGIRQDVLRGIIANDLGLVRGKTQREEDLESNPALTDWLHRGIQQSAGFNHLDPNCAPLTFRDLWRAPESPGAALPDDPAWNDVPGQRSINLQMVTTNITHGRPYRLPLDDQGSSRLFYRREDLQDFFSPTILHALERASKPYRPLTASDPPTHCGKGFLELPGADMPIVVAARLSLSFPVLFSSIPLYAIDYEYPRPGTSANSAGQRELKLCRFSDGGICSNFPIHLFDAAVPRWPTFGMWLGSRNRGHPDQSVWLPEHHRAGQGDQWTRIKGDEATGARNGAGLGTLWSFLGGTFITAKDWADRTGMRMPSVRTRVARLNQLAGEGGLNIAMSSETLMVMAHRYGTAAGKAFTANFVNDPANSSTDAAWREHRWVRLHTLLGSLQAMLRGLGAAAAQNNAYGPSLHELIDQAAGSDPRLAPPLRPHPADAQPSDGSISQKEAKALKEMLAAAQALEEAFERRKKPPRFQPEPMPELRVRPPL